MPTEALLFSVFMCSALVLLMFVVLTPGPVALLACVRAAWNLRGQQKVYVALNHNYAQRYGDTMVGPCSSLKAATIGWLWCCEWPRGGASILANAQAQAILKQDQSGNGPYIFKYFGMTAPSVHTELSIVP